VMILTLLDHHPLHLAQPPLDHCVTSPPLTGAVSHNQDHYGISLLK
jgi:hypothetical protein